MAGRAAVAPAFIMDRFVFGDPDGDVLVLGLDNDVMHDMFAA